MNAARRMLGLVIVVGLIVAWPAAFAGSADEAAKAFSDGKYLLGKGDLEGAHKAFKVAVKTDPSEKDYGLYEKLLGRMIQNRKALTQEKDPGKWLGKARGLRQAYILFSLNTEALALSKQIHEKMNVPESAVGVAEIQLAMGKNQDAVAFLRSLGPKLSNPQTQTCLALALARMGKMDDAKNLARRLYPSPEMSYTDLYRLASVHALTGNGPRAVSALTRAFEMTPPNQLAKMQNSAKKSRDFALISKTPQFETALKTQSRVKDTPLGTGGKTAVKTTTTSRPGKK